MENLKNNLIEISEESKDLGKEYLKYFSLSVSKKLALLAGILFTALFFSLTFLLIVMLLSFTLAGLINELLNNEYAGFLIMTGVYLSLVGILIYKIVKSKTPLFTSLFVRIFAFVFEIESDSPITLEHISEEKRKTKKTIEADKKLILTNLKLLKYVIVETIISEIFKITQRNKGKEKENNAAEDNEAQSSS